MPELQPSSLPRSSASTSSAFALENVTVPPQSMPRAVSSRDSAILSTVTAIAAMPIGMFKKKIDCQPIACVNAPPTSGPRATATPIVAP